MANPTDFHDFLPAWVQTQSADLAPLLGGPGALKVAPFQAARKDQPPRIDSLRVSCIPTRSFQGPSGLNRERFQLSCWGRTAAEATLIARWVVGTKADRRLDGYQGRLANLTVQAIFVLDQRDSSVEMSPASSDPTYCQQIDLEVWSVPN